MCGASIDNLSISMQDSEELELNHDYSPDAIDASKFEEEKHKPSVPQFKIN